MRRDRFADEKVDPLSCAGKNSGVPLREKMDYLNLLGEKRFMHKVNKFEERLKDIVDENRPVIFSQRDPFGEAKQRYFKDFSELLIEHKSYDKSELQNEDHWDQLLYEAVFEGLGYIKNTGVFRKLARNVTLSFLREHSNCEEKKIEAILFGASGLLPPGDESGFDDESKIYCGELQLIWQSLRKKYKREHIDTSEWLFFKLRPQNFPTLRIAGGSQFLSAKHGSFSAKRLLEQDGIRDSDAGDDCQSLSLWRKATIIPAEGFWTKHFVFGSLASTEIRMLIGATRAEEIIINSILPLAYLRGDVFDSPGHRDMALEIYRRHRPTQDNNLTLLIKQDLFGGDNVFGSVIAQQGALHLYRGFCSERRCMRCKIGKAVFRRSTN